MTPTEIDQLLRPLTIKDFRVQCRARGLSPAGGLETLRDRLRDHMVSTKDFGLKAEDGETVWLTAFHSLPAQLVPGSKCNRSSRLLGSWGFSWLGRGPGPWV